MYIPIYIYISSVLYIIYSEPNIEIHSIPIAFCKSLTNY